MLAIALVAALLFGGWAYRGWSHEQDGREADNKLWAQANETNRASIASLLDSLAKQNAAIKDIGDKSAARQKAAQAAFKAAVARQGVSEASAVRIDRERAARPVGGPVCPSGRAVMESRGEL
jgi:hypothetical protein